MTPIPNSRLFLFEERAVKTIDAVFVEVKRHGEATSEAQVAEITRLRALGLQFSGMSEEFANG